MAAIALAGLKLPEAQILGGASATGSTFNTAKFAGITASLASVGANGTSTSILNTDANDRYVTSLKAACQGIGTSQTAYSGTGLVALKLTVGTTTTSAPATIPTANLIANAVTVATATPILVIASSTAITPNAGSNSGNIAALNDLWAAGSYLTFWVNATNTAVCTFGVDYIGS